MTEKMTTSYGLDFIVTDDSSLCKSTGNDTIDKYYKDILMSQRMVCRKFILDAIDYTPIDNEYDLQEIYKIILADNDIMA